MASEMTKLRTWEKTKPIRGRSSDTWRRDDQGNILRWGSYGTTGEYGWEIDHIKPKAKGGSDKPVNLRALHWEINRKKQDKYR